jgi:hypothetical protein
MPTRQQLSVFIDTFLKLSRFEANQRCSLGWGVFTDESHLPISEVNIVLAWLNELKEVSENKVHNPNITPYSLMCFKCRDGRYPSSNDYCVCTSEN